MGEDTPNLPDLIPDREALTCRRSTLGMIASKSWYIWFFGFILGRRLTATEGEEIWSKVTGYHHVPYEHTLAAACDRVEQYRREHPDVTFWRTQI